MSIGKGVKNTSHIHQPFAIRSRNSSSLSGLTGSGCLKCNGSNFIQSINTNDPAIDIGSNNQISLEFWVKIPASQRLLMAYGSTNTWDISLYQGTTTFSSRRGGQAYSLNPTGNTIIPADEWAHIVLCYFPFSGQYYMDYYMNANYWGSDVAFSSSFSKNDFFDIFAFGNPSGTYVSGNGVKLARMTYWYNRRLNGTQVTTLHNGGGLYDFQANPSSLPLPTWNYDFGNNYYFDGSNYRMYPNNNSNPSFYQAGSGGGSDHDFNVPSNLMDFTDHPNLI